MSRHPQSSADDRAPVNETLLAEYRALAASVATQRERAEQLQRLAEHARSQAQRDEEALVELARVLGLDPQMCLEELDERLRGQRLAEIAVRVLVKAEGRGNPVHYKQWYGLLRTAGYTVAGKDPLASFLAAVSRSPQVKGVGQRSGLYMVVEDEGARNVNEDGDEADISDAPPASTLAA